MTPEITDALNNMQATLRRMAGHEETIEAIARSLREPPPIREGGPWDGRAEFKGEKK